MISASAADIERLLYLRRLMAVDHHLDFIQYTWTNQTEPYVVGLHTRKICAVIDEAIERFRHKQSTFLRIAVPFRHGKLKS